MAKHLYKITFLNHGKIYELYGRHVAASSLWGFTEVGELVFDVHDGIVVDPTEERLRDEFAGTKVLHLPMQSIVRIEEVERKGQSVVRDAESGERVVTPFPLPAKPRSRQPAGAPERRSRGIRAWRYRPACGRPDTWRRSFFFNSANAAAIGLSPSSTSPAL
jgi:hypothetical protein